MEIGTQEFRKLNEDAYDLALFFRGKLSHAVIVFHYLLRFNEKRTPCAGLIVDDTRHASSHGRYDRQNESSFP